MKRKLEYVNGPAPKCHSFTLQDTIEKIFAQPSFEKLQSLVEKLKGTMSFDICMYLLKQLALVINVHDESLSKSTKNPVINLQK